MKRFSKNTVILIFILLLGFILRAVYINSSPPSLYGDELTITLDAYSLLKTGHDQLGNFLPLTFQMGAGRPAGYVYSSIPFIAIFGPTASGVRALSILSGVGIILLLYLIAKELFSEKVGLIASALGAFSIWDISLSRGGFEAHFALFLMVLGIYLFIKSKNKPLFYILSILCFGLTLHTYPTYKISLILFLPLLFWFWYGKDFLKDNKKYFIVGIVVLIFLGGLSVSQIFIGGSEKRFADINIFSQQKLKDTIEQKINFERQITSLPQFISKSFHNKGVEYGKVFIENYLQNFSLDFLVLHGDRNPRHNMATMGEVYFADIVFILIGLLSFWNTDRKTLYFLISWILIAPIATAIVDLPHALRSAFMLPPLIILSASGLSVLVSKKNKLLLAIFITSILIQFVFFIQKLYFLAPNEYSNFWSYPAKKASGLAILNQGKYKYIFLSDEIDNMEFGYPVYANITPMQVIGQNKMGFEINGIRFKKFDNIYIGHIARGDTQKFLDALDGTYLYIGLTDTAKYLKSYQLIQGDDYTSILMKSEGNIQN